MIPSVIEKLQKLGFFIYFEKKKIIKKKKIWSFTISIVNDKNFKLKKVL
jgi:hypothetical protein